jgi:hypothetical protein
MKIRNLTVALIAIALIAGVARTVKAQVPDKERAAEDLRDAEAAARRHRAELMKIPHVRVVTGEVDGQHEAAILVEVDDQKNVDMVTRQLPSKIEGFPVEVDEREDADVDSDGTSEAGHWGDGAPTPVPPLIDERGYYHHTWMKPSGPATNSDAPH